jgi:hypothetical protein
LRKALLGTWRLVSFQFDLDGRVVKPFGDAPQGYAVYTPDGHMLIQIASRAQRVWPPGPESLESPQPFRELGFGAYCGTFEVRDGQVLHGIEFSIFPSMDGTVEPRSVVLDDERLILGVPGGAQLEWQRIH